MALKQLDLYVDLDLLERKAYLYVDLSALSQNLRPVIQSSESISGLTRLDSLNLKHGKSARGVERR